MQLIGMLDSPYVRRVAVSLRLLGLSFEHRAVSVFSTFALFQSINPVVKAPSLVCDDGSVLMDSTLILEYAERLTRAGDLHARTLRPSDLGAFARTQRLLGLSLAACEKTVQLVYERNLRPADKHHAPWIERVTGQLLAAYAELEAELQKAPLAVTSAAIDQAGVTTAVVWQATQSLVAGVVDPSHHPAIDAHARAAEALPEFLAFPPDGPGVPRA